MGFSFGIKAPTAREKELEQTLQRILDLCGPPKMSETMATAFSRIKRIQALAEEALAATSSDSSHRKQDGGE
jgi:hypothetical protein